MNHDRNISRIKAEVQADCDVARAILAAYLDATANKRAQKALRIAIRFVGVKRSSYRSEATLRRMADRKAARVKATNDHLIQSAGNRWQTWTEAHDRIVLGADLPDAEIAACIGRSLKAVRVRRTILNKKMRA